MGCSAGVSLQVAFASEAVKGLRYAPMNSANNKTVRFALDCLPRCGSLVYRAAYAAQEPRVSNPRETLERDRELLCTRNGSIYCSFALGLTPCVLVEWAFLGWRGNLSK